MSSILQNAVKVSFFPDTMESVRNTDQAYYSLRAEATHPTVPINTVGKKFTQN
jgi:hypothetical protein